MKTNKLIRKMYLACVRHNKKSQKKIWLKILKKSLDHKETQSVQ